MHRRLAVGSSRDEDPGKNEETTIARYGDERVLNKGCDARGWKMEEETGDGRCQASGDVANEHYI
jgi:hypothetical protein